MQQDDMGKLCVMMFVIGYLALVCNLVIKGEDKPGVDDANRVVPSITKSVVLELPPSDGNPRNSEGDFIRLTSGEILYVYTHYYGESGSDHASARLVSRISRNNGMTWSENDVTVLENEGQLNVMSVSLLRLRDNSIVLFYLVKESSGDCRPYLRYSYDEGETWTQRVATIRTPSYNVVNNSRVVLLSEGRLIIPVARHVYKGGDVYNYESRATVFCLISDDGGRQWRQSSEVPNSNNIMYQEPGVVELADGRLLMTIRNDSGRQLYAYSSDRGVTWTDSEPSPLISPVSPATIKREPNGENLIAIWNESTTARNPLMIATLSPDGKRILKKRTLDKSPENEARAYCYSALFFTDPQTALVAYCNGKAPYGLNSSRIVRVRLEDFGKENTKEKRAASKTRSKDAAARSVIANRRISANTEP